MKIKVNFLLSAMAALRISPLFLICCAFIMFGGGCSPSKITLKVVSVDSEEIDGAGKKAIDGEPKTQWHTQWRNAMPPYPHEIVIELVPPSKIKGFTYLPRQDGGVNGTIKDYEFYVSNDGINFGTPVIDGQFSVGRGIKTVTFTPHKCRFIKLKALSEINGKAVASAAEIGVVTE